MASSNFPAALALAWRPGFDSPRDGYHVTPGDAGGGTKGGVTAATWAHALERGLVAGTLAAATDEQLSVVLRDAAWGPACDALPAGLDLLVFNGRMMTGAYARLFQQGLGLLGVQVDGAIGPLTIGRAGGCHAETLIQALSGIHCAYLTGLSAWPVFGHGWLVRILAARDAALEMVGCAAPPLSLHRGISPAASQGSA